MKIPLRLLNRIALSLAFVLLVGCSTFKRSLTDDELGRAKRIGVMSLLGASIHHTYIGTTIFGNEDQIVPVESWKLGQFTESQMKQILRKNSKIEDVVILKETSGNDLSTNAGLAAFAKSLSSKGIQYLVVLRPAHYDNAPYFPGGYGLYRYKGQNDPGNFAFMMSTVEVIDTTSGDPVAWQWTFDAWNLKPGIVDSAILPWKDKFSEYSPQEREKIEKAIRHRIEIGIEYAAQKLNLLPANL